MIKLAPSGGLYLECSDRVTVLILSHARGRFAVANIDTVDVLQNFQQTLIA